MRTLLIFTFVIGCGLGCSHVQNPTLPDMTGVYVVHRTCDPNKSLKETGYATNVNLSNYGLQIEDCKPGERVGVRVFSSKELGLKEPFTLWEADRKIQKRGCRSASWMELLPFYGMHDEKRVRHVFALGSPIWPSEHALERTSGYGDDQETWNWVDAALIVIDPYPNPTRRQITITKFYKGDSIPGAVQFLAVCK